MFRDIHSVILLVFFIIPLSLCADEIKSFPRSPAALAHDPISNLIIIAEKTGSSIAILTEDGTLQKRIPVPGNPTGLCTWQGKVLVTCNNPGDGKLISMNPRNGKILKQTKVGQGATAPIVDHTRNRAYTCNYFSNDISVIDLTAFAEVTRIVVPRMPSCSLLSPKGEYLFIGNFLPNSPANRDFVAAKISVIDTENAKVIKNIYLENGSNGLRDMTISPDGKKIFITHNLARYQLPTTQLERGWMTTNALSIIDTAKQKRSATVLLDEVYRGAPGSWGISISPDSKYLFVAHSGTHDLSIIDYKQLIEKIKTHPTPSSIHADLSFLSGFRKRVPIENNGPREILATGKKLYIANYFSDSISILNVNELPAITKIDIPMNPNMHVSEQRKGEFLFNDASYCFQNWQSCNSCHPDEARVDGLNWDILNDGIGNPKNVKSLLFSHATPPTTITGCRPNAETSVRAGFKYIQFTEYPEENAKAVDAYLKSLKPEPSPYLVNGQLNNAAKQGKKIFYGKAQCDQCHNGTYLTDLKKYDLDNAGPFDKTSTWDTPTLIEVWRTAPYMHDGRSRNIWDVLTIENHGWIADKLSHKELVQLTAFVNSL